MTAQMTKVEGNAKTTGDEGGGVGHAGAHAADWIRDGDVALWVGNRPRPRGSRQKMNLRGKPSDQRDDKTRIRQ